MSEPLVIPSLEQVRDWKGRDLGTGEWVTVTQERIDAFADATGDHQWIHCDPERAQRETPWKSTIAHGYLTLALVPDLLAKLIVIQGWRIGVNTGLDKLRLPSPVPAGTRVRLHARIKDEGRRRAGHLRREARGRGQRQARLHRQRQLRLSSVNRVRLTAKRSGPIFGS